MGNTVSYEDAKKAKNDICAEVRLIFGLAFFVMYIGCAVLLLLTELDMKKVIIKCAVMFVVFIVMYFICARIVVRRIEHLFDPIETYVDKSNEEIQNLNKQKIINEGSIEEVNRTNKALIDKTNESVDFVIKKNKRIETNKEAVISLSNREQEIYLDIDELINEIRDLKNRVYDDNESLVSTAHNIGQIGEDMSADYDDSQKAYETLTQIITSTLELTDELSTEMSLIQTDASSMNVNSTHVALENARSGLQSFTISNGLDDIKRLSVKVSDKTDEISHKLITLKNSLKLAEDQADFCQDGQAIHNRSFEQIMAGLDNINARTNRFSGDFERLLENVNALSKFANELQMIHDKKQKLTDSTYNENEEMVKRINNMGKSLKKK